jgi:hypothetical protein
MSYEWLSFRLPYSYSPFGPCWSPSDFVSLLFPSSSRFYLVFSFRRLEGRRREINLCDNWKLQNTLKHTHTHTHTNVNAHKHKKHTQKQKTHTNSHRNKHTHRHTFLPIFSLSQNSCLFSAFGNLNNAWAKNRRPSPFTGISESPECHQSIEIKVPARYLRGRPSGNVAWK